jgi:hypothetical protein
MGRCLVDTPPVDQIWQQHKIYRTLPWTWEVFAQHFGKSAGAKINCRFMGLAPAGGPQANRRPRNIRPKNGPIRV